MPEVTPRLAEPLARAVGQRTAGALAGLGLHTVGDLLRHYPRRHAEPGRLTNLSQLRVGEHVTVILDDGPSVGGEASTIIDVTGVQGRVLRRGALGVDELNAVLEPLGTSLIDEG